MIFTAIFPGLKKEWRQVLTQIGSLLGTVIAIKNDSSQDDDRIRGAPSLRILAPRNSELPSYVLLPNLQAIRNRYPRRLCIRVFQTNVLYVEILGI